jgi:hypothetical protein
MKYTELKKEAFLNTCRNASSFTDAIVQQNFMGYTLSAPETFWTAEKEYPDILEDLTNGCGPKGILDWVIPDNLYLLSIKPACKIHDWCFAVWNDKHGFSFGNNLFRNNMQRIIETAYEKSGKGLWARFLRKRRMNLTLVYYAACANFGEHYYYDTVLV